MDKSKKLSLAMVKEINCIIIQPMCAIKWRNIHNFLIMYDINIHVCKYAKNIYLYMFVIVYTFSYLSMVSIM